MSRVWRHKKGIARLAESTATGGLIADKGFLQEIVTPVPWELFIYYMKAFRNRFKGPHIPIKVVPLGCRVTEWVQPFPG